MLPKLKKNSTDFKKGGQTQRGQWGQSNLGGILFFMNPGKAIYYVLKNISNFGVQ